MDENRKPSKFHESLTQQLGDTETLTAESLCEATVNAAMCAGEDKGGGKRRRSDGLTALFKERKATVDKTKRKDLSKQIWAELRKERRRQEEERLDALVASGSGLRALQMATGPTARRTRTAAAKTTDGATVTNQE